MDVFLVPLGPERHELYCEPSDDDETAADTGAPAPGFFSRMRRRFTEMLRAAEAARARRARGEYDPIDTWWERTRARVLAKVADAVAEQRLLWHLRHLDGRQPLPSVRHDRRAGARDHACLDGPRSRPPLPLAGHRCAAHARPRRGALRSCPARTSSGYYFAFRVVGHYLSWRAREQGLDAVTWTTAPCDPADRAAGRAPSGAAAARRAHRRTGGAPAAAAPGVVRQSHLLAGVGRRAAAGRRRLTDGA